VSTLRFNTWQNTGGTEAATASEVSAYSFTEPGSVLVATTSFSGAINVQIDNCFTSTYSVYKVYVYFDHASDGLWFIRMTTGGTPETSVYESAYCNTRAGNAVSGQGGSGQSYMYGGTGNYDLTTEITILNPYQSLNTACHWLSHSKAGASNYNYQTWGGASVNNTNSHDGIHLASGISQNISGNIWVYGVKQS